MSLPNSALSKLVMNRQRVVPRHNCETRQNQDRYSAGKFSKTIPASHKVGPTSLQCQGYVPGNKYTSKREMTVGNMKPCTKQASTSLTTALLNSPNTGTVSFTTMDDATIENDWRCLMIGKQKASLGVKTSTSCESEAVGVPSSTTSTVEKKFSTTFQRCGWRFPSSRFEDAPLTNLIIGGRPRVQLIPSSSASIDWSQSSNDLSIQHSTEMEDYNLNTSTTTSNLWSQQSWSEENNSLTPTNSQQSHLEESDNMVETSETRDSTNDNDSRTEERLGLINITLNQSEEIRSRPVPMSNKIKPIKGGAKSQRRDVTKLLHQPEEFITTNTLQNKKVPPYRRRNTLKNHPPYRSLNRSDSELQMPKPSQVLNFSNAMTADHNSIICSETLIESEIPSIEVLQASLPGDKVDEGKPLGITSDMMTTVHEPNLTNDCATPCTLPSLLWEMLQHQIVRKVTSDILVTVEKLEFAAHKCVLYLHSCYFRQLIEKASLSQSLVQVELADIAAQHFQILYNYMYSGQLKAGHDVFIDVLEAGVKLQMKAIPLLLLKFLDESFDVANALHMYDFATKEESTQKSLLSNTQLLIVKNFGRIINSSEFLRLPAAKVLKILSDDGISVVSELSIFQAAIGWMTYDRKIRNAYVGQLIRCVRFSRMSREELLLSFKEMERLKIAEDPEAKNVMMEAMRYKMYQQGGHNMDAIKLSQKPRHCILEQRDQLSSRTSIKPSPMSNPNETCRLDNRRVTTILVLGGIDPLQEDQNSNRTCQSHPMYLYTPDDEKWKDAGLAPKPWHDAGITVMGDTVYVCGGSDTSTTLLAPGHNVSPETWSLDTSTCLWSRLPDMKTARVHHTATAWQGKIYAIGGIDRNNTILNLVECYSPVAEAWSQVSIMPYECLGAASCEFQDLLWICGGIVKSKCLQQNQGEITDLVQVYSPRKNRWYLSSSLRIPRAFASLTVVKNRLFLVGGISPSFGNNIAKSISDVDIFDLEKNEWQHFTDLFHPRHCCSSVSVGRYLYVIGGMSSALGEVLTSVERYDTTKRKWDCLGAELPLKLTGMGCVVLPPTDSLSAVKALSSKY